MDAIFGDRQVSPRQHEIKNEYHIPVPMRDGVKLNVNISRPDSRGKFPALVGLAPFNLDYQDDYIWPSAVGLSRVCSASITKPE